MEAASRGRRRFTRIAVGVLLGIGLILPANAVAPPAVEGRAAPNGCSSWSSTTRPPDYIRVLRRKSGRVERVPFKKYVITVLGSEWPSYLPQAVVEAGAVASKQFAWYHALGRSHVSRRGQCYDVTDGIYDQLYKPGKANVRGDHYRAVAATWNVRLLKGGRFFMTPYRAGSRKPCGRDRNGNRLYARSAVRCAKAGYNYRQILARYYGPNLRIVSGGQVQSVSNRPASDRSAQQRSAAATRRPASFAGNSYRVFDDRSRQIVWRGSWRRVRFESAIQNTLTYSGRAGSSATFRFTGRTLQLVGRRGPHRGLVDVYVNGSRIARIDLYSPSPKPQAVFFGRGWSTTATRTVKIVVVGARNRPRVEIDAIRAD